MSGPVNSPQRESLDGDALAGDMAELSICVEPAYLEPLNNGWLREFARAEKNTRIKYVYYWTPMGNQVQSKKELALFLPLYGLEHRNFTFVEDELGLGDSNKEIVTIKRPGRHRKPWTQREPRKAAEAGRAAIKAASKIVTDAEPLAATERRKAGNLAATAVKLAAAATKVTEIAVKVLVSAPTAVNKTSAKAAAAEAEEEKAAAEAEVAAAARALELPRYNARATENAEPVAAAGVTEAEAQVETVLTYAKLTVPEAERATGFAYEAAEAMATETAKEPASAAPQRVIILIAAAAAAAAATAVYAAAAEAAASAEAPKL